MQGAEVARLVRNMSEVKQVMCRDVTEEPFIPIQTAAKAYHWLGVLGDQPPSPWTGNWHTLGGINIPTGDGHWQRNGKQVYLKSTTGKLLIERNSASADVGNNAPVQYRVIVFKAKRSTSAAGTTCDPGTSLLVKSNAGWIGSKSSGVHGADLMLLPVNTQKFTVVKDTKFILGSPAGLIDTGAYPESRYPSSKTIPLALQHNRKVEYSGLDLPDDYAWDYGIAIYASAVGKDHKAANTEISMRAATYFLDN